MGWVREVGEKEHQGLVDGLGGSVMPEVEGCEKNPREKAEGDSMDTREQVGLDKKK